MLESNKTETELLLDLNYENVCNYLKNKYGKVPKNYFVNEKMKSKPKDNSRTSEGLIIHHIDEDKAVLLSLRESAQRYPFEYQKAERLVYCNLLEHLILHIKIAEYVCITRKISRTCLGVGGIYIISSELNDIYSGIKYNLTWKTNIAKVVLEQKEDYLKCIKYFLNLNIFYKEEELKNSLSKEYGWNDNNNQQIYQEINKIIKNSKYECFKRKNIGDTIMKERWNKLNKLQKWSLILFLNSLVIMILGLVLIGTVKEGFLTLKWLGVGAVFAAIITPILFGLSILFFGYHVYKIKVKNE